ncbi:MAG: HAD-IC family P-type ATPase, partial [Rhodospirillales bacterium]|nr:HAD-IC family P-type ATPase [Rhodospirillales bacterium]
MPIEHLLHRNWHSMTPDAVMEALDSTRRGLSESEAARRRAEFGANILPSPPRSGMIRVFLRQFKSPLIYLLLAATVMSLAIGELTDAIFIFVVLQVNAAVGTVQEWKAETSAEALGMMIKNRVAVIRDGLRVQADSAELTPGDMVLLESGTRVPADIRLFSAQEVHVDESLLTGESLPVEKNPDARLDAETPTGDRATLLHAGSMVISGRGEGMVVLTGLHTEIGRIAQALTATGSAPPPLVLRLEKFTRNLGLVIIAAVAMLAVAQFLRGMDLAQIFFVAVALAVSAIPEGLPVAITVALSVGAARMARRRVIVRRLPAVEGLGACTLIASDKTGTLTLNKLTVKRLLVPGVGRLQVEGEGYEPQGGIMPVDGSLNEEGQGGIKSLALAAALCNEATFRRSEGGDHRFGDTVDIAFLVFAAKAGVVREDVLERYPEIGFIPFDSSRRYAASFNRDGDTLTAFVKGAAEDVLPMCRGIDLNAGLAEAEAMAVDGYRVLAVAMGAVSGTARDR